MLSKPRVLALASTAILSLTVMAAPASAAGAVVIIQRGGSDCGLDSGDIPGVPEFTLANSTVVVAPNGGLVVTCTGSVPEGVTINHTVAGDVACFGDFGTTTEGHLVATRSGNVSIMCRFAAAL
jgi:hypothetical protein